MTLSGGTLSSGITSGSSHGTRSSGSEGDIQLQVQMDLKRKRRKESNRESAKRSRLRKQQHLDDLTSQVNQLKMENQQLTTTLNMVTQSCAFAESQNSLLRTQMMELDSRLSVLREIIFYMNNGNQSPSNPTIAATTYPSTTTMTAATTGHYDYYDAFTANAWGSGMQMMQQPIDQFLYQC
uniref:BZIP domain-containing protein n=1 Tax=Oryza meridionalis TaxID=40149 RepID=A0A0E0EKQ1_9ORYZ